MIILPILLYVIALFVLWQENHFTFAPSILYKPLHYQSQKLLWMLIPKLIVGIVTIWLIFLLKWYLALLLSICAILLYSHLNKVFARHAILGSVEKLYPSFLEGILKAHEGEELSTAELDESKEFAKFLALKEVWRISTGSEPNELVLSALLKTTGLLRLYRYMDSLWIIAARRLPSQYPPSANGRFLSRYVPCYNLLTSWCRPGRCTV